MGSDRPRLIACAVVAVALIAALPAAAAAKPKHKHPFGSRVLRPGTKGKDVRYLQRSLTRLGIATSIDGAFGKGTTKSVKALESAARLADQRRRLAQGREADHASWSRRSE